MPESSVPENFLVSFTFAGAQRNLVRTIALGVESRLGPKTVFLDEWYEAYLAGEDADLRLKEMGLAQITAVADAGF